MSGPVCSFEVGLGARTQTVTSSWSTAFFHPGPDRFMPRQPGKRNNLRERENGGKGFRDDEKVDIGSTYLRDKGVFTLRHYAKRESPTMKPLLYSAGTLVKVATNNAQLALITEGEKNT